MSEPSAPASCVATVQARVAQEHTPTTRSHGRTDEQRWARHGTRLAWRKHGRRMDQTVPAVAESHGVACCVPATPLCMLTVPKRRGHVHYRA
eukprot:1788830-Prymnesium_polylepis.2